MSAETVRGRDSKKMILRLVGRTAIVLGLASLVPFPTTVVPAVRVRVIEESGRPVPHAMVREKWYHPPLGLDDQEDVEADAGAIAVFGARRATGSMLIRIAGLMKQAVELGVHGGLFAGAMFQGFSGERSGWADYDGGPVVIVVKPLEG